MWVYHDFLLHHKLLIFFLFSDKNIMSYDIKKN